MEDFKSFVSNLGYKFFEHGVTGYRTPLGDHVYTASDDPPEVTMEPHNECSYSPFYPQKVHVKLLQYPVVHSGKVTGCEASFVCLMFDHLEKHFCDREVIYKT